MKNKVIAWIPLAITVVLMYLARITNLGVIDYNLFIILLMVWVFIMINFYRSTNKERWGKSMDEVDALEDAD
jgi:Ca2+/Na+ antiporter